MIGPTARHRCVARSMLPTARHRCFAAGLTASVTDPVLVKGRVRARPDDIARKLSRMRSPASMYLRRNHTTIRGRMSSLILVGITAHSRCEDMKPRNDGPPLDVEGEQRRCDVAIVSFKLTRESRGVLEV